MSDAVRVAALLLQAAVAVTLIESVRRRNASAAVNALVALCVALLPAILASVLRGTVAWSGGFGQVLPLWLAAAGFLHSLGMLGLYESTWWWDHVTHVVSAALVAALVYASLVVVTRSGSGSALPPGSVAGATVGFTLAAGVFWELSELVARDVAERLDVEPVLVYYGRRDTALDIVFDAVGAAVVVLVDLRVFVPVVGQFPDATRTAVLASSAVVVAGTVLMALSLGLAGDTGRQRE